MPRESKLDALLKKRSETGALRSLKVTDPQLIDFSSNDYLGLARSSQLKQEILEAYQSAPSLNGSTGSRLLTGNSELIESCENLLAETFKFQSTTLFSSGYMANLAFFSSVPQKGDTIIYDELSHACIKDGARLSLAKRVSFRHNDFKDLENKFKRAEGEIYVACESVYSMDGDFAPLEPLTQLCKRYNANLIVDEAHSTGIWGSRGSGLVNELGLNDEVFAVIYTFGKAMGIHGACIAGDSTLKDFVVNFARPFIYTTAPSPMEIISIVKAFEFIKKHPGLSQELLANSDFFNQRMKNFASPSQVKSVLIGGNQATRDLSERLIKEGLDVRPILSPTVKEGSERLRICLHTFNTEKEIDFLCGLLEPSLTKTLGS